MGFGEFMFHLDWIGSFPLIVDANGTALDRFGLKLD